MKKIIIIAAVILVSSPASFAQWKAGKQDNTKHVVLNVCPVHSTVTVNQPGKCPFCGMNLNLSQKQELKARVSKTLTCPLNADIVSGNPSNLSLKEQMKWGVVKLNTYHSSADVATNKSNKCSGCGMALTAK